MKKLLSFIIVLFLLIVGITVMMYPVISNTINERSHSKVIDEYETALKNIKDEVLTAEREAAQKYNEGLWNNVILTDPFEPSLLKETDDIYWSLLKINENGAIGYIRIPRIDVKLPIYHGTDSETMDRGAGHLENTSLPIGGLGSHAVLSAHTGSPTSKLFTDLDKMELGNVFFLYVLDETLAYQVDQIKIVLPHEIEDLAISRAHDYVTLITCTPYGINSHRLLVRGTRIDYEEALMMEEIQHTSLWKLWKWNDPYVIALILLFAILLLYFIIHRIFRRKQK